MLAEIAGSIFTHTHTHTHTHTILTVISPCVAGLAPQEQAEKEIEKEKLKAKKMYGKMFA